MPPEVNVLASALLVVVLILLALNVMVSAPAAAATRAWRTCPPTSQLRRMPDTTVQGPALKANAIGYISNVVIAVASTAPGTRWRRRSGSSPQSAGSAFNRPP